MQEGGTSAVRLHYFLRVKNIGDRVNPTIVSAATGHATRWTTDSQQDHLLAIGSMMAAATPRSLVWGTGVIHPAIGIGGADPGRVLAVRGKLSHAEFARAGQPLGDVPLGDPGFLMPRLLGLRREREPLFELGVVPHYVDREHPFVEALGQMDGVAVLDVTRPEAEFFPALCSCRAVISSSLHGLIFAESLGIPNLWIELSDRVIGEGFKFRDWFSLAAAPQAAPFRPGEVEPTLRLAQRCTLHDIHIDASSLLAALSPGAVASVAPPESHLVPASECRQRPVPIFIIAHGSASRLADEVAAWRRDFADIVVVAPDRVEPGLSATLSRLERGGVRIGRAGAGDLRSRLNAAVSIYFAYWAEPSRYFVTDCRDGRLAADARSLALCDELLDRLPRAGCVVPLAGAAPAGLETVRSSGGSVGYELEPWDACLGLHRAGELPGVSKAAARAYISWPIQADQGAELVP
jgi:pyruvyltransferase